MNPSNEKTTALIKFSGSYELLKWILLKYKTQLPYNGELKQFAVKNNYCPDICDHWRNYGVGYRVWTLLQKDLVISHLMDRIEMFDLKDLQKLHLDSKL